MEKMYFSELTQDGGSKVHQVKQTIRRQIFNGKLKPGQKLPSMEKLSGYFGCSLGIVRQGIYTLTAEGVLESMPRKGVFVAQKKLLQGSIALVLPTLELEHIDQIYQNLRMNFDTPDFQLHIFSANGNFDTQVQMMDQLDANMICGAIVYPPPLSQYAPAINDLVKRGIAVVQIADHLKNTVTDAVIADGTEAGRMGFDYLLERGHRRIGMVGVHSDSTMLANLEMGADMALRSYGMRLDQIPRVFVSPTDLKSNQPWLNGQQAASHLLGTHPELTAIIGINPSVTLGIYRAVTTRGQQVGLDVSILSLAGDLKYFQATDPTLTAITASFELIAQRAAIRLQQIMDSEPGDEPQIITLAPKLIERQSVCTL